MLLTLAMLLALAMLPTPVTNNLACQLVNVSATFTVTKTNEIVNFDKSLLRFKIFLNIVLRRI